MGRSTGALVARSSGRLRPGDSSTTTMPPQRATKRARGSHPRARSPAQVDQQHQRQQQALALPQPREVLELGALGGQVLGREAVRRARRAARRPRRRRRACPAGRCRSGAPPDGARPAARASASSPARRSTSARCDAGSVRLVGRRQRLGQRRDAVVQVVEPLDEVDDALVGPQRGHGQRLRAGLADLEQAPVAQRRCGRHHVPRGRVAQGQREREGRVIAQRIALRRQRSGRAPWCRAPARRTASACRGRRASRPRRCASTRADGGSGSCSAARSAPSAASEPGRRLGRLRSPARRRASRSRRRRTASTAAAR
ncbi:MAG: hypothetical protein MZV70_10870 [Desulfobacterales bacterium]|nr:hypothetical protein [Desulfobacterales bacterium]